jgi:hypothetical protein
MGNRNRSLPSLPLKGVTRSGRTDELVAFLAKLREDAIAGVKTHPDGPEGEFRQDVLDLINSDLRSSRARQKRERGNRWKRPRPVARAAAAAHRHADHRPIAHVGRAR